MNVMTLWALLLLLKQYGPTPVGIIAGGLLVLALILIAEAARIVIGLLRK